MHSRRICIMCTSLVSALLPSFSMRYSRTISRRQGRMQGKRLQFPSRTPPDRQRSMLQTQAIRPQRKPARTKPAPSHSRGRRRALPPYRKQQLPQIGRVPCKPVRRGVPMCTLWPQLHSRCRMRQSRAERQGPPRKVCQWHSRRKQQPPGIAEEPTALFSLRSVLG